MFLEANTPTGLYHRYHNQQGMSPHCRETLSIAGHSHSDVWNQFLSRSISFKYSVANLIPKYNTILIMLLALLVRDAVRSDGPTQKS